MEKKKKGHARLIVNSLFGAIILVLVVFTIKGSDDALIVTSNYKTGSEEEIEYVDKVFGEDAEESFNLYFKWFNVIHESGHIIIGLNGGSKGNMVEEEILVNRYAAAYWRTFGESEKYEKVKEIVANAQSKLTDPTPEGTTLYEWIEDNYTNIQTSDTMFNDYGYFQFSINKDVLDKEESLEDVLYEMTGQKVKIEAKELQYPDFIDNEICDKILADETELIKSWGLKFPDEVQHIYSEGTSNNYSILLQSVVRLIFGFIIGVIVLIMLIFNIVYVLILKKKNT